MNAWADARNKDLIPQRGHEQSLLREAAAYLVNATYFEGLLADAFSPVERLPFLFGNGQDVPFDLMKSDAYYATATRAGWRAVRMP